MVDAALWVAFVAAGAWWFADTQGASVARDLVLPLLLLSVAVPLARSRPAVAVLIANGPCSLGLFGSVSPANVYAVTLACMTFLLGARAGSRAAAGGTPLLALAGCLTLDVALCAVLKAPPVWWFYSITVLPAVLVLPWLAGRYWRGRRELAEGGWQLARSLEERQHLAAEHARLAERTAIAADMHDSLGHVLSLVALRAGALELSPTLTPQDRHDTAELRRAVADAVDQLRETVTLLKAAPRAGTGPAAADTVEGLLERAVASGVPVQWERAGTPPSRTPLSERAEYRVVQEALTNATKHAPGATVRVSISYTAQSTRIRIVNAYPMGGARPAMPPAGAAGTGHGLAGLRERVTLLGGTLRAGREDGAFEVTASLPHGTAGRAAPVGPDKGDEDLAASAVAGGTSSTAVSGSDGGTGGAGGAGSSGSAGGADWAIGAYAGGAVLDSVRRLARVRRTTRRRFAAVFAVPALTAALFLPSAAYLVHQLTSTVLPPSRYEHLRLGTPRSDLARLLPARPFPYAPGELRTLPRPPGAACDFYRSNGNLLEDVDLYRLCYSGGRLVAKDVLGVRGTAAASE
ncbi:sensor histidine kinase [Streptomyces sp. NPDC015131]|uniref:sensor histidine kinase n=1 Tax=Streptomyces sp. NPDC015131 TaxID=3364941 RepID=UPI0036F74576